LKKRAPIDPADPAVNPTLGATHAALNDRVAQALRERILAGQLASGERLVEGRLSKEFGVSRIPVREALRLLASEGLVAIEPRRGASVARFDESQKLEVVEVRATLEALNAKLAARRHNPQQISELQRILQEGRRLADEGDAAALDRLNQEFHEALGMVAGNTVLRDIMRSLRDRTALLFSPKNRLRGRQNWDEHAAILQAVVAGDAELAALLSARHVYNAAQLPG
jgi:DNA-binding GntR family transcriptional regulator